MIKLKPALVLIILILLSIGCQETKIEDQKFSSLYFTPSSILASYNSGTYSNDTLSISFTKRDSSPLIVIYKNDTITSKNDAIEITIFNSFGELSSISSSPKNYKKYAHNWKPPISKASSFHQVKVLQTKGGKIIDSLVCNYILGAKTKDELPIVNFQVDPEWMFSPDTGCYVPGKSIDADNENGSGNYYKFKKRKQPATIQIIDQNQEYLNGTFNWRIHGYMTPKAPQKSLLVYLKKSTSVSTLLDLDHKVDKIILRSSYSGWGTKIFVDGFIADACENLNLDVMAYQPLKVYINGEYWGIHGLRERIDLKAIASKHDLKKKNLIDADDKGLSNETNEYGELKVLFDYIKANPNYSYENIKNSFDMPSLVDWLVAEMFFQNSDWPGNNTFFWKSKKNRKDKWKCILIDMDACIGHPDDNVFEYAIEKNPKSTGKLFITYLFNQKEFVLVFKKRAEYLLDNDFSTTQLMLKLNTYKNIFEPVVAEHYGRWGDPDGVSKYNKGISKIQTFCEQRQSYFRSNLDKFIASKSF
jgi:hypothetical protein